MLVALVLSQLLQTCAGNVAPRTMTAIVAVESGGNPLALHDNTLARSFQPADSSQAVGWASALIARGDSVDLGLSQINSRNLPSLGLGIREAFDPCANVRAGATILGRDYAAAREHFGAGQYALRRALSAYNSGSMFAAPGYVDRILVAAGVPPDAPAVETPVRIAERRYAPRLRLAAAALATPKPAYTEVATPGSGVTIIDGNP